MRVMLLARFFFSGQTTHVVELALELARQGHSVFVLTHGRCHLRAWEYCSRRLRRAGIEATRVSDPQKAAAWTKERSLDVIHVHSSDLIPLGQSLARAVGVPLVVTCHGLGVGRSFPSLREADRVIAVGPRIRQDLLESGLSSISLIPNGVDTDRIRPGKKAPKLQIVYLGRVDAAKRRGLQELIQAVDGVPGARLMIASNERPRSPHCVPLGWVWDVAPILASSHVVAGAGRGIREGMAAGCVGLLLNTTYGGVVGPSSASWSQDGWLSLSGTDGEPPDRQVIRRDLLRLAQDETRRRALARWSREYACRHFSLRHMAQQVVALYQDANGDREADQ